MKLIIAGTRTFADQRLFDLTMETWGLGVTCVLSGCARGADTMGERWAGWKHIPVRRFPADWRKYPRRAGPLRNAQMADEADQAIVFWDGKSRGTANLIKEMKARGKDVEVVLFGATPVEYEEGGEDA